MKIKKEGETNSGWFMIKRVLKNIWGIAEFGHNEKVISYLVIGKKQVLLFDTGMGIDNIRQAIKKITHLPILVVNSHTHFDHIGGNYQFDEIFLFDHEFSSQNAGNGFSQESMFGAFKKNSFVKRPPRSFSCAKYRIKPFMWTKKIVDNYKLYIDPFVFTVLHTPGHSPDSICLYESNKKILFSGDTLYPGNIYLHLAESNLTDYLNSIKKLMKLSISIIFPAHNQFNFEISHINKIYKVLINTKYKDINKVFIADKTSLLIKK
ncbi:hypothetical protein A2334_04900 [Candidatus Roizmanbacteria bacterium RIFOXYB2_FULL_38_10]|uniref:Metallo-beta-lactamase domain-containing protein n=1 Tax=Candidatus Roizmanbacteria bacterium RIFOXYD1_FULL_38_12 TaxID=1802093 RepID=A0A1F7KZN5_9BACT|nr:MAG: hypothetical protein A3K47_01000 [Candidatus Roizmanbacteria bacterium RIFOXYA2_FULL_38_14]OGK63362.1 MAG: hypothetical protein A3K27_01000 [Candidatus Roizmanbacteria bacterium RIFOXYA1_FULL_37_12]OGK65208.1 MAG: hypothetical protein A3K38_01000 [Candidatus Roizmanbacteria bacterium RIFOXYB1_FULL_40_23]OGK68761.1 MAG: hypothetical protein A2334_04900 [Candidatus Roizmanbacteria bacterium RIFOXYB2_FULL_38_10]OGK69613.1 MAG: hypothetical protein A3K21_01005 [Candidatus Roizmanbacteria ba